MAGPALVFYDVETTFVDGTSAVVQVVCNKNAMMPGIGDTFKGACQRIRVGDLIGAIEDLTIAEQADGRAEIRGHPAKTRSGTNVSILANRLPELQAPMLYRLPESSTDVESINRRYHVKMLLQPRVREVLRLRMLIEDELDNHCRSQGMTRVRTPIIGASSGGAAADPFETRAKELSEDQLSLRIAPELYLKRLIVGDMHGVYELGPSFRNEGVDATHNPEFTTCEYYQPHATLSKLVQDTESLLRHMSKKVREWAENAKVTIKPPSVDLEPPFQVISFIPHLKAVIRSTLDDPTFPIPNLGEPQSVQTLHDLYSRLRIPLPADPSLLRILDDLSARYIEPHCTKPTWIVGQPACLAPLAKSYITMDGQHVSARAELFIGSREYVNCYEEENSPFEQRKKFIQQRTLQQSGDSATSEDIPSKEATDQEIVLPHIEESYIEALEWGLPPTGGWGCGVDRLVMLFAGVDRIADVLAFGTLRNVAAMGKPLRR